ncbi:hypothetical protein RF11_07396 [Thelohanellus kitauei]|uniref:Uncharacterized protein n=1 Tax=Thelohanellus kitauei TaxID=669202 RepID=A0A0C2JUL3_THEKT|nr:hypothetical protein RF11_07396 [Thelohanellus kitauei]
MPRNIKVIASVAFITDFMPKYFVTEVDKKAVSLLRSEKDYGSTLLTEEQKTLARELDRKLIKELGKAATHAIFLATYNISKHEKSFCGDGFLKKCLLDVVNQVSPEHKTEIEKFSLSRRTVALRIELFSLALDKSSDIDDTAQLLIFLRRIAVNGIN